MIKKQNIVLVAMSGGVDSSVTAALLKEQGYKVIGVFFNFWKEKARPKGAFLKRLIENKCCSEDAYRDARKVARVLDIKLYTFNFEEPFKEEVVDDFISQYGQGNTPNPCVRCNQFVKFGLFWRRARQLEVDYIATGHYVRLKKDVHGIYHLYEGADPDKDQSYFLYRLNQEILSNCLFPVGRYKKTEVRKLAKKFKLPVFQKSDSQEICFIPGNDHTEFLRKYLDLKPGLIVDDKGNVLGEHQGLPLYTVGQRKGLTIGGGGIPYYAAKLDYKNNRLIVVPYNDHPLLYRKSLRLKDVSWLYQEPKLPWDFEVRLRYRHRDQPAEVSKLKNGQIKIDFHQPQRAVTPGQSAVIYHRQEVLGGGIII